MNFRDPIFFCTLSPPRCQRWKSFIIVVYIIVYNLYNCWCEAKFYFDPNSCQLFEQYDIVQNVHWYKIYFFGCRLVGFRIAPGTISNGDIHISYVKEMLCLIHGFLYFLSIPSMYMLLTIYSLCNLNNVSWGTREATPTKTEKQEKEERGKHRDILFWASLQSQGSHGLSTKTI